MHKVLGYVTRWVSRKLSARLFLFNTATLSPFHIVNYSLPVSADIFKSFLPHYPHIDVTEKMSTSLRYNGLVQGVSLSHFNRDKPIRADPCSCLDFF